MIIFIDFSLDKIIISDSKKDIQKRDKSEEIEYFLSNGKRQLIDNLYQYRDKNFNFKNIFNIDLLLHPTNEQLINGLKAVPETKKIKKESIIKSTINIKIENRNNEILQNAKKEDKTNYLRNNFYYTDEYIEAKNKLMNENSFRKFTFPRNTIIKCKLLNNELVPDEDE